ncbi:serine protease [Agriterribacter sp.]|uniref:serine protease n=1 Tax=Agriterribacter sp. TaxID=2821509 RepID=UPI002B73FC5A|nr:serine protease [Agriterribacter sp.]HRO48065.1 serine protease [Agriterribacter sp.]HRQ17252.1 serine protease [Agriterribacter sp.]
MSLDVQTVASRIRERLDRMDKKNATALCNELILFLYGADDAFPSAEGEKILQYLRNKRMFSQMQRVADALMQTGRATFTIHRQYAQSQIDQGNYTAALAILNQLIIETAKAENVNVKAAKENREAKGLLGRVYKQLYVNAQNNSVRREDFIRRAIDAYGAAYNAAPETALWHGINVVALVQRAKSDGIKDPVWPKDQELAASILAVIQQRYDNREATIWQFATACEACVALQKPEEAMHWLSGYLRMPDVDAFEIASMLRQMKEIWRLDMHSEMGQMILPLLQAELLKREGGSFTIDAGMLQEQAEMEAHISTAYAGITGKASDNKTMPKLEKIFGEDSFNTYRWYMTGANRCMAIARIGRDATKGLGTGFLVRGADLHESLGEELLLLTNAHVVSNNPGEKALQPDEAVVTFEVLDKGAAELRIAEILWSSPINLLDASVLRFDKESLAIVKTLTKDITFYPLAKRLPAIQADAPPEERIYIIGHPAGGTLQLSFQDNLLLDYEDPRIHYRTPTTGGSSGSPVFNQQWELIGLHHAGSEEMPRLHGKPGTYQANEGMWIQAIKNAITF